jgi:hypothetical protein
VKILLDENMPHKLVAALRTEGHDADSVHTLLGLGILPGPPGVEL